MKIFIFAIILLPALISSLPTGQTQTSRNLKKSLDVTRTKRSGSFDIVGHIKSGILSGIGRASASVAAGSSGSSSSGSSGSGSSGSGSGDSKGYHYHVPAPHENVKIDGIQLKKAIFNTLFQAVKAITGGVTAIKGQLIKGSGFLVSGGGRLIAASGDAVTGVGKKIVGSAQLIPPGPSHFSKFSSLSSIPHSSSSSNHHPPSGESFTSFEAPPAGHTSYGAPPVESHPPPSTSYGVPPHHSPSYTHPTSHSQSNVYLPATSHGTAYHAPSTSYGSPAHDTSHSNYVDTHNDAYAPIIKDTETHGQKPSFTFDFTSPGASQHTSGHSASLQNAAEALRQILHKLPTPTTSITTSHDSHSNTAYGENTATSHDTAHDSKLFQYEIPPDSNPVPSFKPLKPQYTQSEFGYNRSPGPVHSISHTQTITTAYGAPISDYQKPVPLVDSYSTWSRSKNSHPAAPSHPINPYSVPASSNSYNAYHKMSLKRSPNQNQNYNPRIARHPMQPPPTLTHALTPPVNDSRDAAASIGDTDLMVHQQQLSKLKNTIGADFEIHRSVGYELNNLEPDQIKRRLDETLTDNY